MFRPTHGGNLDWAISLVNCPPSAIIDFSASINPLGPPDSAIAAIHEGVSLLQNYPNPDYPQFCEAISNHHHIEIDWVLPSNGAAELLTWVGWEAHHLDGVLLPSPCFADYKRALATFNLPYQFYNLEDLETGLNHHKNFALLINNPHNPTGKLWSKNTLKPYLQEFPLVIVDEAFMDFLSPQKQETLIDLVKDYDNLIILRSLTKFYSLPGLRIGYGISNFERIKKWQKWRDPWSVNSLAVLAGIASLKDTNFQEKTWQWLQPTKTKLMQELDMIEGLKPFDSSANFILVKTKIPSTTLQLKLLTQEQILIRDCVSFPDLGEKYFRIAVKKDEQNRRLICGLKKIYGNI
ncbi:L-threonine 3-O-phosphate decarboxylase [Geminocystis sp. NIES-3708]|uniref:threonine-phosphate decarboxylase CobD n=1 Tax=Geminocystis sp. NIES-3708 TaxID=1615909 RepID=UPI0005FCDBED|nr:threonine-phosphate decarboxylase CobD [Geminocystis sp. NIES-3708]BAQ61438.1 L-threonine 3-O-phosphate decarboxylase [Geminocystis sp. NIES-3708]